MPLYRISTLSLFLLVFSFSSFAQQTKIDSLEKWIAKYPKKDTFLVKNMISIEYLYFRHQPEKNGIYANAIIDYSKKLNFEYGIEEGLASLAYAYAYKGKYEEAVKAAMQKLAYDEKLKNIAQKADTYTLLGYISTLTEKSNQEQPLEYFIKAKNTSIQLPATYPLRAKIIAEKRINVATGYYFLKQYEKSLQEYLETLKVLQEEYKKMPSNTKNNDDYTYLKAISYLNIGELYTLLNKNLLADNYLKKGLDISIKNSYQALYSNYYNSLAKNNLALKTYTNVQDNLNSLEKLHKEEKLEMEELLNYIEVAEDFYVATKDFGKAYEFQSRFISLNDSLKNNELQQKIKDLTIKYETDKKEQENKQLSEKNASIENQNKAYLIALTIFFVLLGISAVLYYQLYVSKKMVKQTNLKLEEANNMKTEIFKMISHDLKTPATSFLHLTNNINYFIQHKNYQKLIDLGGYAQKLANDLQNIVSNLLYWSMSQQGLLSKKTEQVFIYDSFYEMKDSFQIYADLNQISLQIIVNQDITINANRIYLNTVLRNLISNALKFTDTGGNVILSAEKQGNKVIINVEDSGCGFSENDIVTFNSSKKLSSKIGARGEKGTGLGLSICQQMVELYDGSIYIQNSKNLSGAWVCVSF